jgi:uncharacterized membrane protein
VSDTPSSYNPFGEKSQTDEAGNNEITLLRHQRSISGPIPPPEIMGQYAAFDPSFPDRLLRLAENDQNLKVEEQRTRHRIIGDAIRYRYVVLGLASFFAFALLAAGVWLVFIGKDVAGLIALGGIMAAIVTAFLKHGLSKPQK